MPPTESTILSSYLLNPGRFPAVITLDEFTALFPRAHQSSPQIRALYRDLQHQRNALLDVVSENIRDEVAQARGLRRAVARARKESENLDLEDETRIERDLFGPALYAADPKHSLESILAELGKAVSYTEEKLAKLEAEEKRLLESANETIGNLSDLRYGRLSSGQLRDEVLKGLESVQQTCGRIT